MSAHSRRKGKTGELEVAGLAREAGFAQARRAAPLQAADGQSAPDVSNVGRLWLEVKRRGRGSMYALAVQHTQERAGWVPVMAYREDRGPWLAVLPLTELLKLEAEHGRREVSHAVEWNRGGGGWAAIEEAQAPCSCSRCDSAGKDPEVPA